VNSDVVHHRQHRITEYVIPQGLEGPCYLHLQGLSVHGLNE